MKLHLPIRQRLKVIGLIFWFGMSCGLLLAQNKQGNIWYFGQYAGVDFNSGSPIALNNDSLFTFEGCATMCDTSGNLLFYTDGEHVYNRLHALMPNGTGLSGIYYATQSSLIISKPGSLSQYYIFTVPSVAYASVFKYSIVDMNLAGGYGDIINKNTPLASAIVCEKLAGTYHANGHDIWIAVHEINTNAFYSYQISSSGISAPVISNVGKIYTVLNNTSLIGHMKFSPAGNKVAIAMFDSLRTYMLDFNNSSGVFSNQFSIPSPLNFFSYGAEFSPSGSALYLTELGGNPQRIYQFNMNAGSPAAIIASQTLIHISNSAGGALSLAPNGKIYFINHSTYYLGVINNPDSLGVACNPFDSAVFLGPGIMHYGLPNFISSYYNPPNSTPVINLSSSDTTFCEKHCIDFTDLSSNNPNSWQWFFPGADSLTSTLQNPTNICYSNYGSFDVTLIACNAAGCDTLVLTNFINEYPAPTPTITQSNDTLFSSPGVAYQWWSVDSGIIAGANNFYYIPTQGGSYYVIVTDTTGCEGASNTIVITGIAPLSLGEGQGVRCVPNPNNGNFTLTLTSSITKYFSLRIINPLGQTISNSQQVTSNRQKEMDINMEGVAKGIYLVEVINADKVYRGKFMVQ